MRGRGTFRLWIGLIVAVLAAGSAPAQSRPIHYWNLDQATGNYLDVADGSNPGTPGTGVSRVSGLVGSGAADFNNASTAWITCGTDGFALTNSIAVEAMIRSRWNPDSDSYDTIVRKEEGATRILLALQKNGAGVGTHSLAWGLNVGGSYAELDMPIDGLAGRPSMAELTNGAAHHVAATYDRTSGLKAIYWNGVLVFSTSYAAGAALNTTGTGNHFTIGNVNAGNSEPFNGAIDEVAFYTNALSSAEVSNHHARAMSGDNYFCVAPTAQAASGVSATGFSANWSAVSDATNYLLDVAYDSRFTAFAEGYSNRTVGNVTTYSVSGLTPGMFVYCRLRAQNDFCASVNSGSVTTALPYTAVVPTYYWNLDQATGNYTNCPPATGGAKEATPGTTVERVGGLIGALAANFDNAVSTDYLAAGTNGFTVTDGITLEILIRSDWTAADVDSLIRQDGTKLYLLALQPNGAGTGTNSLAWGLNVGGSYAELDMPLDGQEGRPSMAALTNGATHHVVATYDKSSGLKAIYWDGALVYAKMYAAGSAVDTSGQPPAFTIGNRQPGSNEAFDGVLDEIAFYTTALPAAEVAAHYRKVSICGLSQKTGTW